MSARSRLTNHRQMDYVAHDLRIRSSIALPLRPAPSPAEECPPGGGARKTCGGAKNRSGADVTVRIGATPARLPNPVAKRRVKNFAWEAAPSAFLVTLDDRARYLITDGCDVLIEPLGGSEREMGAFLVGKAFAALLQQRGLTTLHAGAVEAEAGAALFTGDPNAGRSALLGALVERGYALLSDGFTGVAADADGRFVALPASTCVRLPADSLEALGRRPRTIEKACGEDGKYLMPAARLCTEPTAIRAVYVLETHPRADVDVRPASWARACGALLQHTYRKRFLHGLGRQSEHLRTVGEMAAQVPVFDVRHPASPFRLPALAERIAAHLESDAAAHPPPSPPDNAAHGTILWNSAREATTSQHRKVIGASHGRGGLFEQAGAALQRRLAADPNDVKALLRLADLHRGEGRLDAALDACRRVAALRPGHPKASWLCAVLGGEALPDTPPTPDVWPAPFVRVRNFLPPDEHAALLALMLAGREHFSQPALVGAGYVNPKTRNNSEADDRIREQVRPGFEPRLRELVGKALPRLGMGSLGAYRMSLQVRTYQTGEFYNAHTDFDAGDPTPRLINYVYYLHRRPKSFSGGDLLLHDGLVAGPFTRIEPLDNSIVLFPSRILHEVTVVECDPGDFGSGRFSVNGALRKRRADGC